MASKYRRTRRRKPEFHRQAPPGAAPGTLAVDPAAACPAITVIAFDAQRLEERRLEHPRQAAAYLNKWPVIWVNVEGLGDAATIAELGEIFGLHELALEDAINVHQRAKVDQYDGHLFIVARMPRVHERVDTEQVSLFLGKRFLVTFIEDPGDCFDVVRSRIRNARGNVRDLGPDYLAYALLDATIDAYFPLLEHYGERLDQLEQEAMGQLKRRTITRIHEVKTDLLVLRRAIWPHRELFNELVRDATPLVSTQTRVYLRDCYDHVVQMIDLVEMYRELGSDLRDLHLTAMSNRMNEVMKVLTVITTIFMPLTLIAGIYGMNFHTGESPWNMPELDWYFGYPMALGLMATVTIVMLIVFRRRGWLGATPERDVETDPTANTENDPR
jgi:magnesium transporter